MLRAKARGIQRDYEGIVEDYTKAIELDPSNATAEIYGSRAHARRNQRDTQGAIKDYTKAIELDPNNTGLYNIRGHSRTEEGDFQGAIKDYTKAMELDPKGRLRHLEGRAFAKYRQRDLKGALEDYTKAIELEPDDLRKSSRYFRRGGIRRLLGDNEGAALDYEQLLRLSPGFTTQMDLRAFIRRYLGREPNTGE
jgi:tetratricopeptide (TPR) repeat protein